MKTFYIIPLASFFFFLYFSTSFNIFSLLFYICLIFTLVSLLKLNYYQYLCCKHSPFWFSSRQLIAPYTDFFYIFCIAQFQFSYFACGYQVCPTLLDKQISLFSCLNKFSILWKKMISEFLQFIATSHI